MLSLDRRKLHLVGYWNISGVPDFAHGDLMYLGAGLLSLPTTRNGWTENSAIRSADPANHTIEPNIKCVGSPVAEMWPFAYLGAYGTPILGKKGRLQGVSDGTIRKSDGDFL